MVADPWGWIGRSHIDHFLKIALGFFGGGEFGPFKEIMNFCYTSLAEKPYKEIRSA